MFVIIFSCSLDCAIVKGEFRFENLVHITPKLLQSDFHADNRSVSYWIALAKCEQNPYPK